MERRINQGDIVRHFKYETLSEEEKKQNKYVYIIKDVAEHTETGEKLIIYQAMYAPFEIYARPAQMFNSPVDHAKYPNIKQRFRFEKHNLENETIPTKTEPEQKTCWNCKHRCGYENGSDRCSARNDIFIYEYLTDCEYWEYWKCW